MKPEMMKELTELLDEFGRAWNFQVSFEGSVITDAGQRSAVRLSIVPGYLQPPGPSHEDLAKIDFNRRCHRVGLGKDAFGKTFSNRGTSYTICGLTKTLSKYSIIAKDYYGVKKRFPKKTIQDYYARGVLK